jgi:alpha-ketoglutarate-dependent taurine dioxygenase
MSATFWMLSAAQREVDWHVSYAFERAPGSFGFARCDIGPEAREMGGGTGALALWRSDYIVALRSACGAKYLWNGLRVSLS